MPFDSARLGAAGDPSQSRDALGKQRIAVIGAGVSGLSAAWLLSQAHDVVLYETDERLGGHANTVSVETDDGGADVDAGFIVFNKPNYPNFTALLNLIGAPIEESCMSFGVSIDGGAIEYSGQTLSSVFANRRSAVSPAHWAMLLDIVRFHREARRALDGGVDDDRALGDFLDRHRFSRAFRARFLEPFAAAIWSTPTARILDYPAASFFKFFSNHGLLQVLNMPIWSTVRGGAQTYVRKLAATIGEKRTLTPVASVRRAADGVVVVDAAGHEDRFDQVVIGTHADAALAMLDAPSAREREILGAFRYQPNRAVLHTDPGLMPTRPRAWSSWNYMGGADGEGASVSYWMNRLQNLETATQFFVTLNPCRDIPPDRVVAEFDYSHPVFDLDAGRAQKNIWSIQNAPNEAGHGGVWYCGAHFGQGFHEDGLQAGLAVAEAIGGVRRPWRVENESARISLGPAPAAVPRARADDEAPERRMAGGLGG